MYKNATKCNETIGKWCKNKHGASKIIDTFETYHASHAFVGLAGPELRDYLLGAPAFSIFSYDMPGTAYLHRVIVTFPSYLRLVLLSLAIT
jgi:hypothetical protein